MHRVLIAFGTAMLVLAFTATAALAALTFHSGPTVTWDGNSATATADISGLGNQGATASLQVVSFATYTCQNGGGNTAPGQKSVQVFGSPGSQALNTDHSGRDTLNVTAAAPAPATTVGGKEAGCPNKNWTGVDPQLTGPTTATLTISQGNKTIFCQTYQQGSSTGTPC